MKRLLLAALALACAAPAAGQIQSQCTYLTPAGTLRPAVAGDKAITHINQLQCVLGEVRDAVEKVSEISCATTVVPASSFVEVPLVISAPLNGLEIVLPTITQTTGDASSPARVDPPVITGATENEVMLGLFNRDASAPRQVAVCAQIVRF